jgi:hypothetical protein
VAKYALTDNGGNVKIIIMTINSDFEPITDEQKALTVIQVEDSTIVNSGDTYDGKDFIPKPVELEPIITPVKSPLELRVEALESEVANLKAVSISK